MAKIRVPKRWTLFEYSISARNYDFDCSLLSQLPSYDMYPEGYTSCPYSAKYDDIYLFVELLDGGSGDGTLLFWAYLKDYGTGRIRTFGAGVYELSFEGEYEDASEDYLFSEALDELGRCMEGRGRNENASIDLDAELYNFYHVVPDHENLDLYLDGAPRMSVDEAAAVLGCAPSNVKKLVADRELDAYRHKGRVWVMRESVEGFDLTGKRYRAGRAESASDAEVRETFRNWLIDQGFSEFTPSGRPSTVYDYAKRIDAIAEREGATVFSMAANPAFYRDRYEAGGSEEAFGAKSHNAYRAALRCFAKCFGRE